MPQAPPLLSPTVAPSSSAGTSEINLAVPTDAFGGAVGKALEGLGSAVEGASDKIWQRAMDLQSLQNEGEVDKADSAYMEKAGIIHAKFGALQGEAAQAAFPQYIKDLKDARESVRGTMTNPMTQKMFDKTSLSTMGRTIFNGAGQAATGAKMAAIDGVTQRIKTTLDFAGNSGNPAEVEAARQKLRGLNYKLHELKGTPDSAVDSESVINSSLDANVIRNMAKVDPFGAKQMLDAKTKFMSREDYTAVDNFITSQRRAIGSANTANTIWEAGKGDDDKAGISEAEMVAQGRKAAAEQAPDDPIYAQHVEHAIRTKFTGEKQSARQFQWDNKQELSTALQNGAKTVQDILADPKAAAAYHSLPVSEQNKVPGQIERYIKARDHVDNEQALTTLNGMRHNDVEGFLNVDPTDPKYKLSQPQIRQIQNWQAEDKKNPNQNPIVNKAMSWVRQTSAAELQALGIYHRDSSSGSKNNTEDYDRFTGALSEALDAYRQTHGKPADPTEVTKNIVPTLLKTHMEPGFLWGTNKSDPEFKDQVKSAPFKQFWQDSNKANTDQQLPELTQQEAERLWYRNLAKTMYGGKPTK